MDEQSLSLLVAQGVSVAEIGRRFGRDPSTVSYWLAKYGLEAPNRDKHAARGGISREVLEGLVGEGKTIAEIAAAVDRSKGTVRHWLRRHDLTTARRDRSQQASVARTEGLRSLERMCAVHGRTDFVIEARGYYRCRRCRQERVAERRREIKRILVAEAGGSCRLCGYDRVPAALRFHHVDPSQKRLEINCAGATLSVAAMREEAAKCVLLCGNCHVEVETGTTVLPIQ